MKFCTGSFKKGMMHGNGKLRWGQGIVYEGNFVYNCIAGEGTYDWPGGAKYIGKVITMEFGHITYKYKACITFFSTWSQTS